MNNPLVSVIIPVYNGERYLRDAIDSVLAQTYRPIEIIVVDDGSQDGSSQVAKGFGSVVQYHFQSNSGAAATRNRGVKLATGSFLAFLDADDLWTAGKLTRQVAAFDADPNLELVFGHVQQFCSPELNEEETAEIKIPAETMSGQHVGAMLIKRDAFWRVGLFRTDWEIGEFIDWYARAMELGLKSLMLPEVVIKRRLHKNNQGVYKRGHREDYVRVLKAALDRRRTNR